MLAAEGAVASVPGLHVHLGRGEQRHAEVHVTARAVDHDRDADGDASGLAYGLEGLPHGTAGGEHVVHDEGALPGFEAEVASDGPSAFVALRDHAAQSEVARDLVGDDHTAGRRADDELRREGAPPLGEAAAHDLSLWRPLEQVELLEVGIGMATRRELEVPAQERPGLLERLDDDRVYWDGVPPSEAEACSGCELMRPAESSGQ